MAKSVIKSKLDKATEHAQRVDDWNNRMKDFYENTAKMDRFLADLHFVKLKNVNDSMPSLMREHGFKLESNVEDNRLPGSLSCGNTTYCKLVKYRWKGNKVICRQYCFSTSVSREMMRTIGEGTRLMSYFGSRRKSAPYFLEVHKVFYNAPEDERQKMLFVMHEDFPSSSVALHLWNCDVTPKEAIEWTLELAKAAEWLNVTGVAHRFIRPENVLLSGEGNVLLAGFDAAVSFYKLANDREGEKFILQEPGLPREIPFELWDHLPAECFDKPYDPQFVDSWSIGVLLCTMLTGSHPFEVDMAKLSTQAASLPQQWRQSTERANVPYEGKDDDALRSLLDDIFQPAEQRMITFDMIRDIRLLRVISPSKARIGPGVYYRIDNHPHNPPQSAGGSTIVQAVNSYNTSLLSTDCRAMFEQKKWHVNIKSEEALRQRTNGTSYELLRNASFGSSFAVFREPFLAAASLDEAGNRKGFFLAKIFLISRLSPKYGSILRVESSKIMHYLGAHNTIPTLLRAVDIFFAPSKSAFKVIIFYANELLNSKSLHQLTMEKVFEGAQRKDTFDSIMLQLAETVQALAYHGVSHRYLRPEFIFYTSSRIIKVTNLEMMCFALNPIEGKSIPRSKGLHDDQEQNWTHLPPECFFERYDCLLLDVWSYGVVLVFCLTKRIPFKVPHTIIEATKVWSKFNQGNASTLAPFSDLLKKIFQSTENRIKGSELVQWYNLQRMKKKKASDKSSSIGGKPTSKK